MGPLDATFDRNSIYKLTPATFVYLNTSNRVLQPFALIVVCFSILKPGGSVALIKRSRRWGKLVFGIRVVISSEGENGAYECFTGLIGRFDFIAF